MTFRARPKAALLIESSRSYGRRLLRGISLYSRTRGDWSLLRRKPAVFLGLAQAVQDIERLVANQLAAFKGAKIRPDNTLLMPV